MSIHQALTITQSIDRDTREVYDFASTPMNWPRWAAGLGRKFERKGDQWLAEDPNGLPIRVQFTPPNSLGVIDHIVFSAGRATHNAMRVVSNGTGAEVMFTFVRSDDMTDEVFAADAAAIKRDLKALKVLLERA